MKKKKKKKFVDSKFKTRYIFTVVRESKREDLNEAIEFLTGMQDGVGEYLYGGVGKETITLRLEYYDPILKLWLKVE